MAKQRCVAARIDEPGADPRMVGAVPEATMAIAWRRDVDAVLSEAKAQGRHVLLDFSAAPT